MAIKIGNKKSAIYIGNTKVSKVYLGNTRIYPSGSACTYICDGNTYQEELDAGESCLSPKTFTPEKSGWEFAGWRQDTTANGNVLSSLAMDGTPVTLYAVFRQTITLSYHGNSATSGSTAAQTDYRYYNNGNVWNPSFTLNANGFARTGYAFSKWALRSANGTQYAAGESVTLEASATAYAVWKALEYTLMLDSSGWSSPTVVQGYWGDGMGIRTDNPYGGIWLQGGGNSSALPHAVGRITKTINTRGLPKATITLSISGHNHGFVSIGGRFYDFFTNNTMSATISLDTSKASQLLEINVCNYGDDYHSHSILVYSIRFHD